MEKKKYLVLNRTFNFQTLTMRLMRLTSPTDAKNRSSVMARRRAAWRDESFGFWFFGCREGGGEKEALCRHTNFVEISRPLVKPSAPLSPLRPFLGTPSELMYALQLPHRLPVDRRGPIAGIVTRALAMSGIADGNGASASVAREKGHVQRDTSLH